MDTQEGNRLSCVEPQIQAYADTNLNEKGVDTPYIYTTEGSFVTQQQPEPMELNTQWIENAEIIPTVTEAQVLQYQPNPEHLIVQQEYTETIQEIQDTNEQYQQTIVDHHSQENVDFVLQSSESNYVTETSTVSQSREQEVFSNQDNVEVEQNILEPPQPDEASSSLQIEEISEGEAVEEGVVLESTDVSITVTTPDDICEDVQVVDESFEISEIDGEAEVVEDVSAHVGQTVLHVEKTESPLDHPDHSAEGSSVEETDEVVVTSVPIAEEEMVDRPAESENNIEYVEEIDEPVKSEPSAMEIQPCQEEQQQAVTEVLIQGEEVLPTHTDTFDSIEEENEDNPEETLYVMYEDSSSQDGESSQNSTGPTDTESKSNDVLQPKRRRGRKPKQDIPMHVLGHDISKPVENVLNGKSPKPRLGVKVPYRNLTSQIVSKEEIEKEIVERGRKRQEQYKSQQTFAKRLSSKLARKLTGFAGNDEVPDTSAKATGSTPTQVNTTPKPKEALKRVESEKTDQDNLDLLAILEGDGDDSIVLPKPVLKVTPATDETNLKNLEREIALRQLQELPRMSPRKKFMTNRHLKELPVEEEPPSPGKSINLADEKPAAPLLLDVEPQIKVNMALKTYSRKRKTSEPAEASPEKKVVPLNTSPLALKPKVETPVSDTVYVTKSSRVIKKKVIWDPDEAAPARPSKPTTVKTESPPPTKFIPVSKPVRTYEKADRSADRSAALSRLVEKKLEKVSPKEKPEKREVEKEKLATKKRSLSPAQVIKSPGAKATVKPKKSRSEVDKLLGDEGAIKMLYDLKNTDDTDDRRKAKSVISVEKTFKDLVKKANEIKSDLVNTSGSEQPKSLRKKDGVSPNSAVKVPVAAAVLGRQKSKDSNRSSVHTPPASPAFPFPNETSYLIRRRSSSSLSSSDNVQDDWDEDGAKEKQPKRKSRVKKPAEVKEEEPQPQGQAKEEQSTSGQKTTKADSRLGNFQWLTAKKTGKHVTIDLQLEDTFGYFTVEVLAELTVALNRISKEKDCNGVLLRSSQVDVFGLGLDYRTLVAEKDSERKALASDLAEKVSEFVKCLLHFPKVLVAGVQGECAGLSVTMLALFDLVVSSDSAMFSTPYSSLGCVAEAGFLLTVPYVANHGLAAELLYTNQKLKADEVFRRGLISKLCWPEKYQETVKHAMQSIAKGSKQSLEATKKQLRGGILKSSEAAVDAMTKQLIEHWSSNECQRNFSKIE
ncbi:uncharacterized protein LOC132698805 isoform X2 [Cylas formicarius]|uniref:uncharacterized protein LOC132698805 isoform X2 n=1 Tax=Cylas formicarius TaxID=197179 RepID=UPI002958B229|nr:uncharacterized protein LOC132698805 isoform X2 [Cylas formicarius]